MTPVKSSNEAPNRWIHAPPPSWTDERKITSLNIILLDRPTPTKQHSAYGQTFLPILFQPMANHTYLCKRNYVEFVYDCHMKNVIMYPWLGAV